jgi:hypothetical protein
MSNHKNMNQPMQSDPTLYLTDAQYAEALVRLRDHIAAGSELIAWSSDVTGDKDQECSWGLCTCTPELWPADTRMWPDRPLQFGRVYGVKYRDDGHDCPLARPAPPSILPSSCGCFYRCRVFAPDESGRPDRATVLALYDAAIMIKCLPKIKS